MLINYSYQQSDFYIHLTYNLPTKHSFVLFSLNTVNERNFVYQHINILINTIKYF